MPLGHQLRKTLFFPCWHKIQLLILYIYPTYSFWKAGFYEFDFISSSYLRWENTDVYNDNSVGEKDDNLQDGCRAMFIKANRICHRLAHYTCLSLLPRTRHLTLQTNHPQWPLPFQQFTLPSTSFTREPNQFQHFTEAIHKLPSAAPPFHYI